ncbi:MAG TPA: CHASE3 domain-containing protein [Vicinamibacterales bacterium]|nr:CHASE3 domain-containing protein [Vicinamibacterales bacterium]
MRRSLTLLVAAVIAALVLDAWVSYRNVDRLLQQERNLSASYLRVNALDRTLSTIKDAETGQRGFLLTGDPQYLVPYTEARSQISRDLTQLQQLWPNGNDSALIAKLRSLIQHKLTELQQTVVLRQTRGFEAAERIVATDVGRRRMNQIRDAVGDLRAEEHGRLVAATASSAAARRTAFETAAFASALALVTVLFCVGLIRRDLAQRARLADERAALLARERAARTEAEQANRLKDDFLATLSHELRNPLHALVGWLQILEQRPDDAAFRARAIQTIERNARTLQRMIEDLLDASRAARGKIELNQVPTRLDTLVDSVVETLRPSADSRGVNLQRQHGATNVVVTGDHDRLAQVLINLVSNAIKFTPARGRVDVSVARDGAGAVVRVADTGCGINQGALLQIFEPFRQAGPPAPGAEGGLGLGLAIARQIVELHGGTIGAESEGIGRGSTFTVRLPAYAQQPSASPQVLGA